MAWTQAQAEANEVTIAKYLYGKGLNENQVAGIIGNWQVESDFNPNATGDNGLAYGIAQWHPDRRPAGGLSSDLNAQLDWFWAEANGPEKAAFTKFKANSSSPSAAAAAFDQYYERSDGTARVQREQDAITYDKGGTPGGLGGGVLGDVTNAITNPVSGATAAIGGVVGWTEKLGDLISWITDVHNLERVGYFVVGGVLVVVGAGKLFSGSKSAGAITGLATKFA